MCRKTWHTDAMEMDFVCVSKERTARVCARAEAAETVDMWAGAKIRLCRAIVEHCAFRHQLFIAITGDTVSRCSLNFPRHGRFVGVKLEGF